MTLRSGVCIFHTFHEFQHCLKVELRTWKLRLDGLWLCSIGRWVYLIGIWDCSWSLRQLFANINSILFEIFVKGCWKCSHSILERLWWCLQILCTHILERLKQENCWKLVRFSHPMEDHICYATLLRVHTLCINWNLNCAIHGGLI
jgi:hypothetical protein